MLGKRIPTILAIVLLLTLGGLFWFWQRSGTTVSRTETMPISVKITNIADNKFSVSWTTQEPTLGRVEYGSVGERLDKQRGDDRGDDYVGKTHHITVGELQPNTNYAFRIMSGEDLRRYDNEGSVYTVTTGSTISTVPAARSLYGDVEGGSEDTIVYVTLPDAQAASVTVNSSGSYSVPLSTIRSADLRSYVTYDPAATVVSLLLSNGDDTSQVTVSTNNITPVPLVALGQNSDFRSTPTQGEEAIAEIAQVEPQPVEIFNVDPITDPSINAVTNASYTLSNPAVEGEVLATTRPEFRGTGDSNAEIEIAITGQKEVRDTVRISAQGVWSWSPAIALGTGKQKITISYKDKDGKPQTIVRNFSITSSGISSEPAFVATPSASTSTSSSAASASASPRVSIPATDSGVPVTGVITPMLLTTALGFAIMVVGALLLAL